MRNRRWLLLGLVWLGCVLLARGGTNLVIKENGQVVFNVSGTVYKVPSSAVTITRSTTDKVGLYVNGQSIATGAMANFSVNGVTLTAANWDDLTDGFAMAGTGGGGGGGGDTTMTWARLKGKPFDNVGSGLTVSGSALTATPGWTAITGKPFNGVGIGATVVGNNITVLGNPDTLKLQREYAYGQREYYSWSRDTVKENPDNGTRIWLKLGMLRGGGQSGTGATRKPYNRIRFRCIDESSWYGAKTNHQETYEAILSWKTFSDFGAQPSCQLVSQDQLLVFDAGFWNSYPYNMPMIDSLLVLATGAYNDHTEVWVSTVWNDRYCPAVVVDEVSKIRIYDTLVAPSAAGMVPDDWEPALNASWTTQKPSPLFSASVGSQTQSYTCAVDMAHAPGYVGKNVGQNQNRQNFFSLSDSSFYVDATKALRVKGGGGDTTVTWGTLKGKPFTWLGEGLRVDHDTIKTTGSTHDEWNEIVGKPFDTLGVSGRLVVDANKRLDVTTHFYVTDLHVDSMIELGSPQGAKSTTWINQPLTSGGEWKWNGGGTDFVNVNTIRGIIGQQVHDSLAAHPVSADTWQTVQGKPFTWLGEGLRVDHDTIKTTGSTHDEWNEIVGKPFETLGSGFLVNADKQLNNTPAWASVSGRPFTDVDDGTIRADKVIQMYAGYVPQSLTDVASKAYVDGSDVRAQTVTIPDDCAKNISLLFGGRSLYCRGIAYAWSDDAGAGTAGLKVSYPAQASCMGIPFFGELAIAACNYSTTNSKGWIDYGAALINKADLSASVVMIWIDDNNRPTASGDIPRDFNRITTVQNGGVADKSNNIGFVWSDAVDMGSTVYTIKGSGMTYATAAAATPSGAQIFDVCYCGSSASSSVFLMLKRGGNIYKTEDGGSTFTLAATYDTSWEPMHIGGSLGNIVIGGSGGLKWSTDGKTWNDCTFNGVPAGVQLNNFEGFSYSGNGYIVTYPNHSGACVSQNGRDWEWIYMKNAGWEQGRLVLIPVPGSGFAIYAWNKPQVSLIELGVVGESPVATKSYVDSIRALNYVTWSDIDNELIETSSGTRGEVRKVGLSDKLRNKIPNLDASHVNDWQGENVFHDVAEFKSAALFGSISSTGLGNFKTALQTEKLVVKSDALLLDTVTFMDAVNAKGNIIVEGNVTAPNGLTVNANATVNGIATVDSLRALNGLSAFGDVQLRGKKLYVGSATTFAGNVQIDSLDVKTLKGDVTIGGGLEVTNYLRSDGMRCFGTLTGNNMVFNGSGEIHGDFTLAGGARLLVGPVSDIYWYVNDDPDHWIRARDYICKIVRENCKTGFEERIEALEKEASERIDTLEKKIVRLEALLRLLETEMSNQKIKEND